MADVYDDLEEGLRLERSGDLDRALERYRSAAATDDPWLWSEALRRQASVHHTRSDWETALALSRQAASVAADAGLSDQLAEALNTEASVYMARGEFDTAMGVLERVLETSRDARIDGLALHNLGAIAAQRGFWEDARRHFMASVKCFQRAGYHRGVAIAHNNYGRAALDHGNFKLATDLLGQAVESARRADDRDLEALARMNHAEAIAGLGDLERADSLASSALAHFTSTRNTWRRVECLRLIGDIARRRGDDHAARRYFGEALARAREIGARLEVFQLERRLADLS